MEGMDYIQNETTSQPEVLSSEALVQEVKEQLELPDLPHITNPQRIVATASIVAIKGGAMDNPVLRGSFVVGGEMLTGKNARNYPVQEAPRGDSAWGQFVALTMPRNRDGLLTTPETRARDRRASTFPTVMSVNEIPVDEDVIRTNAFYSWGENMSSQKWTSGEKGKEKIIRTNDMGITSPDDIQVVHLSEMDWQAYQEIGKDTTKRMTVVVFDRDDPKQAFKKRVALREKLLNTNTTVLEIDKTNGVISSFAAHEHSDAGHQKRALSMFANLACEGENVLRDRELQEMLEMNDQDFNHEQLVDGGLKSVVIGGEQYEKHIKQYEDLKSKLPTEAQEKFSFEKFEMMLLYDVVDGDNTRPGALNFRRSHQEQLDSMYMVGGLKALKDQIAEYKSKDRGVSNHGRQKCIELVDIFNKDRSNIAGVVGKSISGMESISDPKIKQLEKQRLLAVSANLQIARGAAGGVVISASREDFIPEMPSGEQDSFYVYNSDGKVVDEFAATQNGYSSSAHAPFQDASIAIHHEPSNNRIVIRAKADYLSG